MSLLLFLFAPFSLMPFSVDHPSENLIIFMVLYYSTLKAIVGTIVERIVRR